MVPVRLLGQDSANPGNVIVVDAATNRKVSVPPEALVVDSVGAVVGVQDAYVQSRNSNEIRLFNNAIPSPAQFDSLTVPDQGSMNIIYHEFYDSAALTSAAANSGTLFLTPQSQIFNGNLKGSGTLSNNERFFMIGMRFELENNDTTNPLDIVDVVQTFRLGTYQFKVGSDRTYNSSKKYIDPRAFTVLNTKYYAVKPFISWQLPLPIAIGKQMQFNTDYTLTAATLDATTRLFDYIIGFWYQNVQ
jgi:hypothetical protein